MDDEDYGPAFDSNVLGKPALRKLLGLWMEASGTSVALLPQVVDELTPDRARGTAAVLAQCWRRAVAHPQSYFKEVSLSDRERDERERLLYSFPVSCFPVCDDVDDIPNHPDAIVVAEAAATGASLLLTRDVRTMDHFRINEVVSKLVPRNEPLIAHVDDALNEAHNTFDGGRELLATALSSVWPQNQMPSFEIDETRERLSALSRAIREGAGMTLTADRLINLFDRDEDLEQVFAMAADRAAQSKVLRLEGEWRTWLSQTRPPRLTR